MPSGVGHEAESLRHLAVSSHRGTVAGVSSTPAAPAQDFIATWENLMAHPRFGSMSAGSAADLQTWRSARPADIMSA